MERGEALMGTTIRPELSEKNPYWIEKHRYYELKHFCLQYPIWRKAYSVLDGYANPPKDSASFVTPVHLVIQLQNAPWLRHIILSVQIWSRELQSRLIENWRSIF